MQVRHFALQNLIQFLLLRDVVVLFVALLVVEYHFYDLHAVLFDFLHPPPQEGQILPAEVLLLFYL